MRTSASLVSAAVISLACTGAARAGSAPYKPSADAAGTSLYSCIGMINVTGQGPVKNYFFLTDAFPVPKAESTQLQQQWHDYVQSQHPGQLVSLDSCSEAPSDTAQQQANSQGWIDKYKSQATITRTTWKYGAAAGSATAAVVQQQPSGGRFENDPNAKGYFCTFDDQSGYDGKTGQGVIVRYLSQPFSSTSNFARLGNDWSDYIRTTYHEPAAMSGSCMLNHGRYEDAKKTAEASKTMKVVLVDWKE
jgi:hypothetical protein